MAHHSHRPGKDQTGFLAQIDYFQVSKLLLPLGGIMKHDVRDIALQAKLPSARRKDSQGICFLGKINYNDFIKRFLGEKRESIIELETGRKSEPTTDSGSTPSASVRDWD